jgi:hypothetical protein
LTTEKEKDFKGELPFKVSCPVLSKGGYSPKESSKFLLEDAT